MDYLTTLSVQTTARFPLKLQVGPGGWGGDEANNSRLATLPKSQSIP